MSRQLTLLAFQGLKIVSLGVAKLQVPEPGTPLKESGIWYPEIPRYPVCLNEEILPNLEFYSTGYFPLFWVPFGGAGGRDLELLTSIQITMVDGIWGIEFSYCDGRKVEKLGRHPYDIDLNPEVPNISTFEIDGPHGERISSISLWYDSDTFVQGQINKPCGISVSSYSLFVWTNTYRGRSIQTGATRVSLAMVGPRRDTWRSTWSLKRAQLSRDFTQTR